MKKQQTASVVGRIALAVALTLMLTLTMSSRTQATNTPGNTITDHALADGATAAAVGCKSDKSFIVYITMKAVVANTDLTVTFVDTTNVAVDSVSFPLVLGQIVNITQAAGGTPAADGHLVVSGTAVGDLLGWMSISTQTGAKGFGGAAVDFCRTYTTLAAAIADP
ncbi:MAG: hypothetical protein U1B94_06415 [candidate division NC10 bacterium]|nr:hypothetical protein [candidate division NC10 bacterium]